MDEEFLGELGKSKRQAGREGKAKGIRRRRENQEEVGKASRKALKITGTRD